MENDAIKKAVIETNSHRLRIQWDGKMKEILAEILLVQTLVQLRNDHDLNIECEKGKSIGRISGLWEEAKRCVRLIRLDNPTAVFEDQVVVEISDEGIRKEVEDILEDK